jgi:pilus assembly protein CpaE
MPSKVNIAIELADSDLAKSMLGEFQAIPNVEAVQWFVGMGEKGPTTVKTVPHIIVFDDDPDARTVARRIQLFREKFPLAAYFVVTANQDPQHIVEVMKAGVAEYLVTPIHAKTLAHAVEDVRTKLANGGKIARGSVYSFVSSKGGLGSTVVATNTAYALAQRKDVNVALFDMSLQSGDASVLLDLVPNTTIFDLVKNFHRLDASFLGAAMVNASKGLDFLAAPPNPEDYIDIQPLHVATILELARKLYDHIVVDCPSMSIDERTIEIFKGSEKIFLVIDLSVPAIRNAARLCELLEKDGISLNKVEITANRYIKGGSLSVSEVEKTLGKPLFWLFPNDFKNVISSINKGIPLIKFNPGCPFSKNIMNFVDKVKGPFAQEQFRGVKGLFGRAI